MDGKNWLIGYGFSIDLLLSEENERTPLEVIDSIFPDVPVVIMEQNLTLDVGKYTVALGLAGINDPDS